MFGRFPALARSRHARDRRGGQYQGPGGPREGPRRDVHSDRRRHPIGRDPRGGGSRPPEVAQESRTGRRRSQPARHRASNWASQGDWRLYFIDRDRIEKVTPARSRRSPSSYLTSSNRTVGFFIPSAKPERTPVPPSPDDRQARRGLQGPRSRNRRASRSTSLRWPSRPACSGPKPIEGVKLAFLPKKTRGDAGAGAPEPALRHGREPQGQDRRGRLPVRPHDPRDEEPHPPADPGRARQELRPAGWRRWHGPRCGWAVAAVRPAPCHTRVETKRANLPAVLEILRQVLREPTLPENEFEVMKNERAGRPRARPVRPDAPGRINHLQRLLSQYPIDDVRYVPTVEEEIERLKAVTIDQVRSVYRDYLGASHGELTHRGRLRSVRGSLPVLTRTFEGWKSRRALCAHRTALPAWTQGNQGDHSDARQGQCQLLRGHDPRDEGQQSRLSRPCSSATPSSAAAASRRALSTGCGKRGAFRTGQGQCSQPAPSTREAA